MDLLATLIAIATGALLLGLAGIVLFQMANGTISLAGLLYTKGPSGPPTFSPARLQMLIATIVIAAHYVISVIDNPVRGSLPAPPVAALVVLGGSHATYVGSKVIDTWVRPLLKGLDKRGGLP